MRKIGASMIVFSVCGVLLLIQKFPSCVYMNMHYLKRMVCMRVGVCVGWCAMVRANKCHSTYLILCML